MIVVFGSLNVDFVTSPDRLPGPGETVLSPDYAVLPGGKGANQAVAAARAGARVAMIGAVGDDQLAEVALRELAEAGVDLSGVARVAAPTGAAFIAVDPLGENNIVVAAGANGLARPVGAALAAIGSADTLLLQREVPERELLAAAHMARAAGSRVMFNLAPFSPLDPGWWGYLDVLVVNEHEARDLAESLGWSEADPVTIARRIARDRKLLVIVTLGGEGAFGVDPVRECRLPAPRVTVIDTVGAGDALCGALAAALDAGLDWPDALRRGLAAGSLACTRAGAQPSLPRAAEIDALLTA
jgi:ribokinase